MEMTKQQRMRRASEPHRLARMSEAKRKLRTYCLDCKAPMQRVMEIFVLRIRQRLYRCVVCHKSFWRYYDLPTRRYYPNFVAAINGQIAAEIAAENAERPIGPKERTSLQKGLTLNAIRRAEHA